jgi:hypothetical protein
VVLTIVACETRDMQLTAHHTASGKSQEQGRRGVGLKGKVHGGVERRAQMSRPPVSWMYFTHTCTIFQILLRGRYSNKE